MQMNLIERRPPVGSGVDVKALFRQESREKTAERLIVVDNEDRGTGDRGIRPGHSAINLCPAENSRHRKLHLMQNRHAS
jgi:hypothetical protein